MKLAFVGAIFALAAIPSPARQGGGPAEHPQSAPSDAFVNGKPFTFEQLQQAAAVVFEARLIRAIRSRKIDFSPTTEQLAALRTAGASDNVLDAVRLAAPATSRPPHAERREEKAEAPAAPGALTIRCDPAECEAILDDHSAGTSANGVLTIPNLAAGRHSVLVRKFGYVDVHFPNLVVKSGETVTRSAQMSIDRKLAEERGPALFSQMQDALGGEAFLKLSAALEASGDAVMFNKGQRTEWTMHARLSPPDWAYFQLNGAGASLWVAMLGDKYRSSRQFGKHPMATEVETGLRLFRDYQLAVLIKRVKEGNFQLTWRPDLPSGFLAANAADGYEFTLGPESLPQSVKYSSPSGLGSGLEVRYADYLKQGSATYPKETMIRLPEETQHGMQIRFRTATLGATLTEKDFLH